MCRHGVPSTIYSDKGTNFTAEDFKKIVAELLGAQQIFNPAYSPSSSGTVERIHQTIGKYLDQYLAIHPDAEWDRLLPYALAAYRSAYHSSLGCSPFEALYGRTFKADFASKAKTLAELEELPTNWMFETARRVEVFRQMAADRQNEVRSSEAITTHGIMPGDMVRVRALANQKDGRKYSDPQTVVSTSPHTVTVQAPTRKDPGKTNIIHVNNVKTGKPRGAVIVSSKVIGADDVDESNNGNWTNNNDTVSTDEPSTDQGGTTETEVSNTVNQRRWKANENHSFSEVERIIDAKIDRRTQEQLALAKVVNDSGERWSTWIPVNESKEVNGFKDAWMEYQRRRRSGTGNLSSDEEAQVNLVHFGLDPCSRLWEDSLFYMCL